MPGYRITLGCRNYDRTQAVINKTLRAEGVDLDVVELTEAEVLFTEMFRGKYDVAEFSFGEMVYQFTRNPNSFVAIPVFPLKMFRHSWIFVNSSSGIRGPGDLRGKKIGIYRLAQTASIWIRGILKDEYGLSPNNVTFCAPSIHHWPDESERIAIEPHDGSVIHWLEKKDGQSNIEALESALRENRVDAICGAVRPPSFVRGDPSIRRLFENYEEVERAYFEKTRIIPIMHVLVARKEVVEDHPDLPEKLFELFRQAKKVSNEWIKRDGSLCLAWKDAYLDRERLVFADDSYAYGMKQNAHVIRKFLDYCHDQGVSPRQVKPEEFFARSTWDLQD